MREVAIAGRADQRENPPAGEDVSRSAERVAVAAFPLAVGRQEGDGVTPPGPEPGFLEKRAEPGGSPVWELGEPRSRGVAIADKYLQVERLKATDEDERKAGCGETRPEAPKEKRRHEGQTEIVAGVPRTISFGSVSSCTCSTVTPGASSFSSSPSSVTSITQ